MYSTSTILAGLGLTLIAGLATGAGSCIAFFFKKTNTKFLSFALGFSGGVMVYISLVELLADAHKHLAETFGHTAGSLSATGCFFAGMAVAMLIDRLVPSHENPHEVRTVEEMDQPKHKDKLMRSGLLFALPMLKGDSTLSVTGKIESAPYIGMTVDAIAAVTGAVSGELPCFSVVGVEQNRGTPADAAASNVGGDWSGAAFFITAGVLCDEGKGVKALDALVVLKK